VLNRGTWEADFEHISFAAPTHKNAARIDDLGDAGGETCSGR